MFHTVVIVTMIMAMIMICAVVNQVELNHKKNHREKLPCKNRILIMLRQKPMAPMIKTNFGFSTSVCSDALNWSPIDSSVNFKTNLAMIQTAQSTEEIC